MPPLVDVSGLCVRFGDVVAVNNVDLAVQPGTALALVGRNGAGKSTTLRVLGGVLPATAGQIRVAGIDVRREPARAKEITGYCPDVGGLIPRATPWEHLALAARLRGMPDERWQPRARDLLEQFGLAAEAHRLTAGFSHGMSRRLSVALAAFHRPHVLLLDEPFDGVDPLGVEATTAVVREALAGGAAVVVSTHLLHLAVEVCGEAVVMRAGTVVGAAPAADLAGDGGAARYRELLT